MDTEDKGIRGTHPDLDELEKAPPAAPPRRKPTKARPPLATPDPMWEAQKAAAYSAAALLRNSGDIRGAQRFELILARLEREGSRA